MPLKHKTAVLEGEQTHVVLALEAIRRDHQQMTRINDVDSTNVLELALEVVFAVQLSVALLHHFSPLSIGCVDAEDAVLAARSKQIAIAQTLDGADKGNLEVI
jgi:hypothetical protein